VALPTIAVVLNSDGQMDLPTIQQNLIDYGRSECALIMNAVEER
jgi:hypothetical protein